MGDPKTRRCFLDCALKGGMVVGAAGMLVPACLYLWPARARGPRESLVPAGPAEGFEPGTARMIQADGRPLLVIAVADRRFRAFSAICTHLGCVVKWDPPSRTILCPCHAGVFGDDGKVRSGPPPGPLPQYEVVQVGGELRVKL